MIDYAEAVTVPEVRSVVKRLLDVVESDPENSASYQLTILALLSFYRKNLKVDMNIETNRNPLKSRIIQSGVLYFGPMFTLTREGRKPAAEEIFKALHHGGFAVEQMGALNATQLELFYIYVKETGLIRSIA